MISKESLKNASFMWYAKVVLYSFLIATPVAAAGVVSFWVIFPVVCVLGCLLYDIIKMFIPEQPKEPSDEVPQEIINEWSSMQDTILHLEEILDNYEEQLDSQVVDVECNCGKSLFKGILYPNEDNICKCPHCESTYRVNLKKELALLSQPLYDDAEILEKLETFLPED